MITATLLFTYNRSSHTKQVIEALKRNTVMPQKLFIFQDGLKDDTDEIEWKRVNNLIREIDWCNKELIVSVSNKGLADSILAGINYAFKEYEAIIILEDDCVPTTNFISYMNQCLDKYADKKMVYSVNGYSWPIEVKKQQYDVYGCGRISSWGWGTWRDRWYAYEKDYEIVKRMKRDAAASRNLAMWGQDLEDTLVGNVKGTCDSWAVFWALNVISRRGICISPYQSFIKNIGMDGSGVHCGITNQFDVECVDERRKEFKLPEYIDFSREAAEAFASLHGSYTALDGYVENRRKAVVYGVGNFFLKNERQVNEEYHIEMFIDRYKKGYFAGKRIIGPNAIEDSGFERLLIMVQDEAESLRIAHDMTEKYGIPERKIEFGFMKYKN